MLSFGSSILSKLYFGRVRSNLDRMLLKIFLAATAIVCAKTTIDLKQVEGLKELLKVKGGNEHFIATCNIAIFKPLVDYNTATELCSEFQMGGNGRKGNLATVNDADKNSDLVTLLELTYPSENITQMYEGTNTKPQWAPEAWVWVGLQKTKHNKEKTVKNTGGRGWAEGKFDWQWVADGSHPTDYAPWYNKKQPDQAILKDNQSPSKNSRDYEICEEHRCYQNQMRINHEGLWDDTWKFMRHPYACDYQGKYIVSTNMETWVDAKEACANAGLYLAKVRNSTELNEMINAIYHFAGDGITTDSVMKTRWDPKNWIWLGGHRDLEEDEIWRWLDGELVEETWDVPFPWINHAGNDHASRLKNTVGQDALAINRDGYFDDSYSNTLKRKRMFACQCPGT